MIRITFEGVVLDLKARKQITSFSYKKGDSISKILVLAANAVRLIEKGGKR